MNTESLGAIEHEDENNLKKGAVAEANDLLKNGIFIETNTGLVCMTVNDALSKNLNLSVEDLKNVAAQLILQESILDTKPTTGLRICESDGFSSECSDSTYVTSEPSSSFSRPKSSVRTDKSSEESDSTKSSIDVIKSESSISFYETPIITKKKGRGGWPKGRKRKPELLNLPPKAPATGYNLYLNEQRGYFKDSNLLFYEITKIIGNKWSSLSLEEKKPYLDKAEEDKKRYREELKQYRQSDAYRTYLSKKRKKKLQNNVLSESDMDATDDFDEEDNEELYCRTCDQWFHNFHNKKEHLQAKKHLTSVAGDIHRELKNNDSQFVSTSLDESSLDCMSDSRNTQAVKTSNSSIDEAMNNLLVLVYRRDCEIKTLRNRQQEAIDQQKALCQQLLQLNERFIFKRLRELQMTHDKLKKSVEVKFLKKEIRISWFINRKCRKIHPESNSKIQQVDGGFFEKFGMLFRENAEMAATQEQLEKEKVAEAAAQIMPSISREDSGEVLLTESGQVESETEDISENSLTSSDSENEQDKDKTEFISAALNIDELYTEVLYTILHNVGCDISLDCGQTALFSYAQDAFKIQNEKHRHLLEVAESKEDPELMINVEVIEAKDLRPKDSNGMSDPFVTLYLTSNTSHRYNTSVKTMTLNPVWEEHFGLPIADNAIDDTLCLEVWDFDPAETVKEKLGKIFEVKGVKGMRKLVKEIAVTATTGQHENELIGRARIPLKTIPASGMTMWYSIDKKNKLSKQGVLKVRISFSSGKNNQVAEQEHRHIRRIVLLHELEVSEVAPYWWCGSFSPQAQQLLTQHIAQSGLSPIEVDLCSYSVYAGVHQSHPLSFSLFSKILEKLVKPMQTSSMLEEDVKLFWEATKKLLPSCFNVIRKIRKKSPSEKAVMKQVVEVLKILSYIRSLEPPENFELFPSALFPWITTTDGGLNCDIVKTLEDAVTQGVNDWMNHIIENNKKPDNSDISKLQNLLQVIQLVRTDLQKAIEFYDKLFLEIVKFPYAKCLYKYYESKISNMCESDIEEICTNLKRVDFGEVDNDNSLEEDPLSEGTTLFELYLAIQRFVTLGDGLCPTDCDGFQIKQFHQWFHKGVAQWLDIAAYKALQRIAKAVELDQLIQVDNTVKYSSSAVDTLTIFYQVKVFWQQLNWPDVESSYSFIAKIIDDICRCCVFYADKMSTKVEGMGETQDIYEKKFHVTNEWCVAINNIDYVRETLEPFTSDLGIANVIRKIGDLKGPVDAERCQHTFDNVVANAIDTVRNKIVELIETMVIKMAPSMKRLLVEGAELCNQDSNSVDRLMMYVDNNLSMLHKNLNEENFNRTLEIVWDHISGTLNDIIQSSIEKRRPPSFFANLSKTLDLMLGSFKTPDVNINCSSLQRTEQILRLNGMETPDLIHEINLKLAETFDSMTESPYGEIAFRCKFEGDAIYIEIMNARNLIAMDSNGTCDSFVRMHFLPAHKFGNIDKPKTKCHYKTQFPLYDEKFTINLTPEQRELEDGMILLSVKDKDLLGYNNQYIGEAFIHFKDIEDTNRPLNSLNQVYKWLGRPVDLNLDGLKALENRQGDKQAKEFLRKYRQRMGSQ
ncbi:protein unc-13 homolog 4B [Cylas formicarius]|uniref:protein unc-13 homolog 4B n=1 Tax=Cylas formicarius TaxID=197179 RepID=UPI002958A0DB|nr:protein unc-13 homolog 4B [Cylas formicarius]